MVISFVDHLRYFCLMFVMHLSTSVYWCLVATCMETADLLAFVCGVYLCICHFPMWYPGSSVIFDVSIPYLCHIFTSYFFMP